MGRIESFNPLLEIHKRVYVDKEEETPEVTFNPLLEIPGPCLNGCRRTLLIQYIFQSSS